MSFLTSIFGAGEANNGKTPEQLDAELVALQRQKAQDQPERYGGADYEAAFGEHLALQVQQDNDVPGQLDSQFQIGLQEGAARDRSLLNGAAFSFLSVFPWWAYLIALLALASYLGIPIPGVKRKA